MAVVDVLVILTLLGAWRYDGFLSTYNVQTVMRYNSMFAHVALGMCFVIMTGGIDLSVGSVLALSAVVGADLLKQGMPVPVAVIAALGVGALAGLVNGIIITRGKIPPFIATLGMLTVARGLTLMYTGGQPFTGFPGGFREIGAGVRRSQTYLLGERFSFPPLPIDDDGQTGRLYTSPRKLFARLTSEFNSHLAVHHDQVVQSGTNFHAVVHAQPRHLTYLSHIPRYQYEPYLNRHLLRWQPELIVQLPEGIGHVPFLVPEI